MKPSICSDFCIRQHLQLCRLGVWKPINISSVRLDSIRDQHRLWSPYARRRDYAICDLRNGGDLWRQHSNCMAMSTKCGYNHIKRIPHSYCALFQVVFSPASSTASYTSAELLELYSDSATILYYCVIVFMAIVLQLLYVLTRDKMDHIPHTKMVLPIGFSLVSAMLGTQG